MSLTAAVVFYTSSGIDPMLLCFDRHLTTEKQQAKKIKVVLLWTLCSWSVSGWNVHKKALSHTVLFLYFSLQWVIIIGTSMCVRQVLFVSKG